MGRCRSRLIIRFADASCLAQSLHTVPQDGRIRAGRRQGAGCPMVRCSLLFLPSCIMGEGVPVRHLRRRHRLLQPRLDCLLLQLHGGVTCCIIGCSSASPSCNTGKTCRFQLEMVGCCLGLRGSVLRYFRFNIVGKRKLSEVGEFNGVVGGVVRHFGLDSYRERQNSPSLMTFAGVSCDALKGRSDRKHPRRRRTRGLPTCSSSFKNWSPHNKANHCASTTTSTLWRYQVDLTVTKLS